MVFFGKVFPNHHKSGLCGILGGFFSCCLFFFFFFFNFLFGCLFCYVSFPWVQTKVKEFNVNCDG